MRLLVTGGQGFVGRHVVAEWLRRHPDGRVLALGRSPRNGWWPATPGRKIWSVSRIRSPTAQSGRSPPAALVTISVSQPSACSTRTGKVTCCIE